MVFVRSAFVCAVLITLIVGWYVVERVRGRALWERYEKEAMAAGVKLAAQDYLPAPAIDAENFAAIPIFDEIFRAQAEGREVPNPLAWPKSGGTKPPPAAEVKEARMIDLAAWQKFFAETGLLKSEQANPAQGVMDALKTYDPILEELSAASLRPHCRFPVRWEDGVSAALPHLSLILSAGRQYALRINAHLALGENDAAVRDVRDSLHIYQAMTGEPALIAGLVRVTILMAIESAVWDGLARRQWRDADLEALDREFADLRVLADYRFSMNSERALGNEFYPQLRAMSGGRIADLTLMVRALGVENSKAPWQARLFTIYPQGWFYRSQERTNRYFDEMIARVSLDPPRLSSYRPLETGPENVVGFYKRAQLYFFSLMAPVMENVGIRYGYVQALTDQTRIAGALERFRFAHGDFPAALAELPVDFSMPADVVNGEPYHYRRAEGGGSYTLYSVATNLKDDGGDPGVKATAAKQPDWVWFLPAK